MSDPTNTQPQLPEFDPNATGVAQAQHEQVLQIRIDGFKADGRAIERMLEHAVHDGDQAGQDLCDHLIARQIVHVARVLVETVDEIKDPKIQSQDVQPFRAKRIGELSDLLEILGRLCGVEVSIIPIGDE